MLGANPDWRLLADFGPTRRLVLLAINSTATTPPGVINFAGDEGRLAFAVWRAGAAEALLKKTELRAAPPNIRPQYLLLNDALMIVAEPLDERLAARPGLRTVAGLDEHLLLLVRRDFLRRHGQLVERLLDVLCETPAAALADATRLLARIAVALNATPQWTREQIVGLSFGGAGEAACRKSVRPGDATRRQLDAFVAAGKQAGLVRREFSLDSALK